MLKIFIQQQSCTYPSLEHAGDALVGMSRLESYQSGYVDPQRLCTVTIHELNPPVEVGDLSTTAPKLYHSQTYVVLNVKDDEVKLGIEPLDHSQQLELKLAQLVKTIERSFPNIHLIPELVEFLKNELEGDIVKSKWHVALAIAVLDADPSCRELTDEFIDGFFTGWKIMMETFRLAPITSSAL